MRNRGWKMRMLGMSCGKERFAVLWFGEVERRTMWVEFPLIYLRNDVKCVIYFQQKRLLFGFGRGKLLIFYSIFFKLETPRETEHARTKLDLYGKYCYGRSSENESCCRTWCKVYEHFSFAPLSFLIPFIWCFTFIHTSSGMWTWSSQTPQFQGSLRTRNWLGKIKVYVWF